MEGVAAKKAILDRYNELAMNYSDETADEMTAAPGRDRGQGPVGPRQPRSSRRWTRCAARPTTADVDKLSGGERRRVALCQLLLEQPDLLLLDEPTNHLDAETVAWLEDHLRDYPGAILIVTHDRYFLDNVTGWILELDRGRGIPYEGNYSAWLEQKPKRLEQEGREDEARQRALEREREWIAASPEGAPGQVQGAHPAYEELRRQGERAGRRRPRRSSSRSAERLGQQRHRGRGPVEGLSATGC